MPIRHNLAGGASGCYPAPDEQDEIVGHRSSEVEIVEDNQPGPSKIRVVLQFIP